jgi:hypothetical protein
LIQKKQDVTRRAESSKKGKVREIGQASILFQGRVMPRFDIFLTGQTPIKFQVELFGSIGISRK